MDRQIKLKYFYNPLNKKEYIFLFKCQEEIIDIYLIEDEDKYIKFNKEYQELYRGIFNVNIVSDSFEVFYNEFDENNYVIISYKAYEFCCCSQIPDLKKYIDIIKLENKQLKLIKKFEFVLENNCDIFNLIYKNDKNYSIIIISNNNIQIAKIQNKLETENLVEINSKLNDFLKFIKIIDRKNFDFDDGEVKAESQPCSIIKNINKDYLYICNKKVIKKVI